jgi:hypothetical protein
MLSLGHGARTGGVPDEEKWVVEAHVPLPKRFLAESTEQVMSRTTNLEMRSAD